MSTERDKGRDLEERVAAILRGHDYKVATNVVLKGRSGARHELDVVGDTFDGLTSFRVVVECKAWARPIDKDIVYRLASELADLGAARGIIASLSSWTPQAVQAANQAHIELWGPDELKARLRHVALSETQLPHVQDSAQGLAFVVESEVARSQIERIAKGKRRVGREEITWFGPLWLPTWSLRLGLVRMQGHLRRVPRATRVWNSYEALTGRCTRTYLVPPLLVDVDLACGHLPPVLNVAKVEDRLTTSWTRWRQVTSGEAKKQHAAMLAKMGVPVPVYGLAVEAKTLAYLPLWAAFLSRGAEERLVAIDGTSGKEQPLLDHVLTTNARRVHDCLRSPEHGRETVLTLAEWAGPQSSAYSL